MLSGQHTRALIEMQQPGGDTKQPDLGNMRYQQAEDEDQNTFAVRAFGMAHEPGQKHRCLVMQHDRDDDHEDGHDADDSMVDG